MIETYNIEREMDEVLNGTYSMQEMKEKYAKMAVEAFELSAEKQALEESMFSLLNDQDIEKISKKSDELLENFFYRNTTDSMRKILQTYGYIKPIVLINEKEDINFCFDEEIPILLLFKDNTERLAKDGIEVQRHLENGGLIGMSQYSYEKMEYIKEFGLENW